MVESLKARIEVSGQPFEFRLCARPLGLGVAGPVTYYWMDSRQFRAGRGGANFRACVDHWWAAMRSGGDDADPYTRDALILAECYPLVNRSRSIQGVYGDAHLHPAADRQGDPAGGAGRRPRSRGGRAYSLPAAESGRLRALAGRRDAEAVRAELEGLFLGPPVPAEHQAAFRAAFEGWLALGRRALGAGGRDGLRAFVAAEIAPWMDRLRRRGGRPTDRSFLNRFAYQVKVAFYLCHANAWIGLVPWLVEHRGLDAVAARLLRLWHHQNQPVHDAATPGGRPDAFFGQVLALHPLSAVVMEDPAHRQAVGAWLAHPEHDALVAAGRAGECAAYWDLVAAILTAAHEYRHARDAWSATRGVKTGGGAAVAVAPASAPSLGALLEEHAAGRGRRCPRCAGPLGYVGHEPPAAGAAGAAVDYRCRSCGAPVRLTLAASELMPPADA